MIVAGAAFMTHLLCKRKSALSKLISMLIARDPKSNPSHSMHSPATLVYPTLHCAPATILCCGVICGLSCVWMRWKATRHSHMNPSLPSAQTAPGARPGRSFLLPGVNEQFSLVWYMQDVSYSHASSSGVELPLRNSGSGQWIQTPGCAADKPQREILLCGENRRIVERLRGRSAPNALRVTENRRDTTHDKCRPRCQASHRGTRLEDSVCTRST